MAFGDNATVYPIRGQKFEFMEFIKDSTTGNPCAVGTMTLTVSLDGATVAANQTDTAVTAGGVSGMTGAAKITIGALDMTCGVLTYTLSSNTANAVTATGEIKTINTTERTGHWYAQTVKRVEDMWAVMTQYIQNRVTQNNSSENIEVHAYGSTSTVLWTNVVDNDGTDEVKAQAS